jgi:hypothetical protein
MKSALLTLDWSFHIRSQVAVYPRMSPDESGDAPQSD